jgi:hypothetical protein
MRCWIVCHWYTSSTIYISDAVCVSDIVTMLQLTGRDLYRVNMEGRIHNWKGKYCKEYMAQHTRGDAGVPDRLTLILPMWRIEWAPNSIPIYIQQDATLHSLFISWNFSTCFGWYFHPKHVEKFPDINELCNVASCWIYNYTGIYLQCTDP